MKIYLVDSDFFVGYDYAIEQQIIDESGNELILETCKDENEVAAKCQDADILMTILVRIGATALDSCKGVKGLVRYGIGLDAIDMDAANERKVPVCNFTDYCIPEVATHALALILSLVRNLPVFDRNVRQGLWTKGPDVRPMHRASSQILGLAGFGRIAQELADYAKAVGYTIIAYDPFLPKKNFVQAGVEQVDLDGLFARSDILSIHTPLTPETYHLINKETLAKMKDGVILVNTARGPVICEADLIQALKDGKVSAAGLDVVEFETISTKDHPYVHMDNVLLSPHSSYSSEESTLALHERAAATAVALCKGELPYNTYNKKAIL